MRGGASNLTVRSLLLVVGTALVALSVGPAGAAQGSATAQPAKGFALDHAAVLGTYCATCHSDRTRSGGLSFEHADLTDIPKSAETWEKVIRKVRAGMMPPPGMPRPDGSRLDGMVAFLETSLDRAAAAKPRPGRTTMHRLNRAEYANAVRDLLALDIDATALLPPDDESSGFDNIADVLTVSPSLMERYLSASWNISRMALGNTRHRAEHGNVSCAARSVPGPAHRRIATGNSRRDSRPSLVPGRRRVHDQGPVVAQHLRSDARHGGPARHRDRNGWCPAAARYGRRPDGFPRPWPRIRERSVRTWTSA